MTSSDNINASNNENNSTTTSTSTTSIAIPNNEGDGKVADGNRNNSDEKSSVEIEYLEITAQNAWPTYYEFVRNETNKYKYTCDESKKPENRNLNRYRDVSPYDHTRVILERSSCNYINANILQMEDANRKYILTQGPLPITAGHFWLMVWEQNSKAIIMLNKVVEKTSIKCHQYWPKDISADILTFPDVELEVEFVSSTSTSDYTTSTLRLTDIPSNESREILHFHYTAWPDFGTPKSPTAFLRFLADVRLSGALEPDVGPSVIHCSAGIGRSGTFCLVDTCLVLLEKNGMHSVKVRQILMEMRKSRMGLIQTPDQLRFSYVAIIEASKRLPLTNTIACDDTVYSNYDTATALNIATLNDEEPPPIPPPRGESLNRLTWSDLKSMLNNKNENTKDNPPNKPLPCEPPRGVNSNHIDDDDDTNSNAVTDVNAIRQRRRLEKMEKLDAKVRDIKRKQKKLEDWHKFKRSKLDSGEQSSEEET